MYNRIHDFEIKYLYNYNTFNIKTFNPFVCTILFGLSESSKIILIKYLILEKNEFKNHGKEQKQPGSIFLIHNQILKSAV